MADDAGYGRLAAGADLAIEALEEVDAAGPKLPAPAEVADAVGPIGVPGEGREGLGRVADEAADGVGVKGQEEGDEEVMGVPESLKRLLADAGVGRRVHEQHAQQHDVAGDAARLGVVNLEGADGANLRPLDIVKVDVVRSDVQAAEAEKGVDQLAVHPEILVQGQEADLGPYPAHEGPADGQEDQHAIDGKDESGSPRDPYGVSEGVEARKTLV